MSERYWAEMERHHRFNEEHARFAARPLLAGAAGLWPFTEQLQVYIGP
jgi:hypothetical protein